MRSVRVIAAREFLSTVRRPSYLIVTLGMPFFLSAYMAVVGLLPAYFMMRSGAQARPTGVVDLGRVVRPELLEASGRNDEGMDAGRGVTEALPSSGPARLRAIASLLDDGGGPVRLVLLPSKDDALRRLRDGDLERVFVVPGGYLETGAIETYKTEASPFVRGGAQAESALARLLRQSLASGNLPDGVARRLERPIERSAATVYLLRSDGRVEPFLDAERLARMVIPGAFALLFLMSLLTSAGYLLQGLMEEKENRVIEVILSSVTPRDLLLGKLFGLGAAGILQLGTWVMVVSFASSLLAVAALAYLNWRLFLFCLLFFAGGYMMVGSLMTGTGALGSNARESQQLSVVWALCLVLPPAITWMPMMEDPNTWMARALGWFPLTGPITMMVRLGTGKVPAWDAAIALVCLACGVYLSVRVSTALFRLGLLMYGKRPSLREVVRQLRHA